MIYIQKIKNLILKHKRYIIIASPILLLLAMYYLSKLSTESSYMPERPVILVSGLILDSYAFEDSTITVSFTQGIPNNVRDNIRIAYDPEAGYDLFWSSGTTFSVVPRPNLTRGKEYTFNVYYKNTVIGSKSFTISEYTPEEIDAAIVEQVQTDFEYAQNLQQITSEYPWYYNLPIIMDDFTVVYDYDLKKFRIRLNFSREELGDQEISTLVSQARVLLGSTEGVPANYEYYVLFSDE